ncbi:MAG: hypothetical protein ABR497_04995, partial [Kiritimatiellia bacterium]
VIAWSLDAVKPRWQFDIDLPAQVEALISNDALTFIAGPKARTKPLGPGFLAVLDASDGGVLTQIELPVAPVHDGLAASEGALFAVLRNGTVVCYAD